MPAQFHFEAIALRHSPCHQGNRIKIIVRRSLRKNYKM